MSYHAWKCVPTAVSCWVNISEVPECHLLRQMSCQCGSHKLIQEFVFHQLTVYLPHFDILNGHIIKSMYTRWLSITQLSKAWLYQYSRSSFKLLGIFSLCETNLDKSSDTGSKFVRGYLSLILKYYVTHVHGLEVYVKKGLP